MSAPTGNATPYIYIGLEVPFRYFLSESTFAPPGQATRLKNLRRFDERANLCSYEQAKNSMKNDGYISRLRLVVFEIFANL